MSSSPPFFSHSDLLCIPRVDVAYPKKDSNGLIIFLTTPILSTGLLINFFTLRIQFTHLNFALKMKIP